MQGDKGGGEGGVYLDISLNMAYDECRVVLL
jgi:hypothetical protein